MNSKNNLKFILIFSVMFIMLCIFPFSLYLFSKYNNEITARDRYIAVQNELLEQLDKRVNDIHGNIIKDLEYLISSYIFNEYIKGNKGVDFVSSEWLIFSSLNKEYDQIRYIDENGDERIRINNSGEPIIVDKSNLQNKKNRYYFRIVSEYLAPEILVSYLDLNIENGKIEIPIKPMLRYSIPVYNKDGDFKGVVVINYLVKNIFKILDSEQKLHGSNIYLLNNKGYFLYGANKKLLWTFMYESKKDITMFNTQGFPNSFDKRLENIGRHLYIQEKINLNKFNGYKINQLDKFWVILTESKDFILYDNILFHIFASLRIVMLVYVILCLVLSYLSSYYINKVILLNENRALLKNIMSEVVSALEVTSGLDDDDTGNHVLRVCEYSYILAKAYGLSESKSLEIKELSSLHDIGKVGVHDSILKKEGPLNDEEWEEMKKHVFYGRNVIRKTQLSQIAYNIVLYHHENWDGSGYMGKLKGDSIPIEARIVAVADVYDALRNKRCYKPAFSHDKAISIMLSESGKKFDPKLISCFIYEEDKFNAVSIKLK